MKVLSLFNGMNTGRQALENVGIKVDKYYSSELKPFAIELTQHHFPDTIQLGDVTKWKEWQIEWSEIDLVLSGSPCQDLSIAGNRKGLKGSRSSLFYTFIDIYNHIKSFNPKVLFFQENVGSAPKEDVRLMSEALGVLPVRFNSSLVTAQQRDRYYWTNIRTRTDWTGYTWTDIPEPEDRKIMFKDIIESGVTEQKKAFCLLESEERMVKNQESLKHRSKKGFANIVYVANNEVRVKTNTKKGYDTLTENDCLNLSFPTSETRRSRITKGKAPCLLEANEPLYALEIIKNVKQDSNKPRQINPSKECGGTQPSIQNRIYDPSSKMPALTESFAHTIKTTENYTVRTLTQTELERLQGFPDGYTSILSRNKAASLLGDGWTLPMIEHFFKYLK